MAVCITRTKKFPLTPVEFEYRIQRDESTAIIMIRPILQDGSFTNRVERVEVLKVCSVWQLGETSAERKESNGPTKKVLRGFLEEMINHSPQELALIDSIHRRLLQDRIAIPCPQIQGL